jgi:hypothetical protein
MMAGTPQERHASMAELAADIERVMKGQPPARRPAAPVRVAHPPDEPAESAPLPWGWITIAAGLVVLVLVAARLKGLI